MRISTLGLILIAAIVSCAVSSAAEPSALEVRHAALLSSGLDTIEQSERHLPVVGQADVVIAGGGVAGVAAALHVAQMGRSVILIEPRNQLGQEFTATYQCRTAADERCAAAPLARAICGDLNAKRVMVDQRVDPHGLRSYFHSRVASQPRITTFLFSMPTGVVCDGNRVRGVVFVSHNGRQVVLGNSVIDATPDARIARAAGAEVASGEAGTKTARRFIAIGRSDKLPPGPRSMATSLGFVDDRIVVHDGFLEFAVRAEISEEFARDLSVVHAVTLAKSFAVRDALAAEGIKPASFAVGPESWIDEMPVVSSLAGLSGLGVAGRIADARPESGTLQTLLTSGELAGQAAIDMARHITDADRSRIRENSDRSRIPENSEPSSNPPNSLPEIRELLEGIEPGRVYPTVREPAVRLPIRGQYDVLVVGGGTSGAIAAIAAARQGARVAVVEALPNLGGTSSNRVNSYYWGVPWKSRLRQELGDRIRLTKSSGTGPLEKVRFSGEDKKHALQELAFRAGVTVYYQSFAAGAVVEERRVTGVVVENVAGRHVLLANIVIDATGHGDIAVAAGAEAVKGRCTDGFLQELEHGPLRDPTHPGDISVSYLRAPSPAVSLNIRESRRILGDYVVTFDDAIHERLFPDTICRWRSNYDTHFPNSASQSDLAQDWTTLLGLWRRPILGSIPYRCLLPQGLDNLLVAAKAYSTDHDALIGGRMQSDLEHLGEAAGIAAAMACQLGVAPRQIPVDGLQAELVRLGVLRDEDVPGQTLSDGPSLDELHRQDFWRKERDQQFPPTAQPLTLEQAVARLGTGQALEGMVRLYLAGDEARDRLRPFLDGNHGAARDEAALVLAMLGDRSAVPVLIEWLEQRNPRRFTFALPEASSRPSVPLYWSAVILLGRFGEKQAVPAMLELLGSPAAEDYAAMLRTNYNSDMFEQVGHCPPPLASFILVALGRIADPQAADSVRPFLKVSAQVGIRDENTDFEIAWAMRTHAAWALMQMGDRSGIRVLEELSKADQALLRNHARTLLEKENGDAPLCW